jgi:hypothetical protein
MAGLGSFVNNLRSGRILLVCKLLALIPEILDLNIECLFVIAQTEPPCKQVILFLYGVCVVVVSTGKSITASNTSFESCISKAIVAKIDNTSSKKEE